MKKILQTIMIAAVLSGCGDAEKKQNNNQEGVDRSAANVKEVTGVGKVEPESKIINLAATASGIVSHIYKTDGDSVKQGDKLVTLEDETERLKTQEINSQITTQRSQIAIERSNADDAQSKLSSKKRLLITTRNLVQRGAETQQVYDDLETEVRSLEVSLAKSKENIRLAQSKLGEISQQLNTANAEAGKKILKAPTSGRILSMQVTQGAALTQYATYAEFAPKGALIVRAEVDELFSQKLKEGQLVDIRYAGSRDVIAKGKLIMLSPYLKKKSLFSEKANDQEDRRVREVRIHIEDNTGLVINSKVECVIKL